MEKGAHNKMVGGLLQESVMEKAITDKMNAAQKEQQEQLEQLIQRQENQKKDDSSSDGLDDLLDDPEVKKAMVMRQREFMADLQSHQQKMKNKVLNTGPGQYRQLTQDEFLPAVTQNQNCVVHFFHKDFERCKIVDQHLQVIAQQHGETKVYSLDVEKAPFFVQKLQIQVLPCVIMFKKGVAVDRVVGFEDLGGSDTFNTAVLARKFIAAKVMVAKQEGETLKVNFRASDRNNRRRRDYDSDEDSDSGNDY